MRLLGVGSALLALVSCTTFYGVEPGEGTTTSTGGGGNGGEGGGFVAQDGFLSRFDAAHTCSLLFECPSIAHDLADSIGVATISLEPLVRASYSSCVDWLSQPLRRAHPGFDTAQPIVACLAVASSCVAASACMATENLSSTDARCLPPTSTCDGDDWLDCANTRVVHCATAPFGEGARCYEGAGHLGCGVGYAATSERSCSGSTLFTAAGPGAPRLTFDCAALGLVCDGAAPEPDCAGKSGIAHCDVPFATDCSSDGARAGVCTSHGLRAEVDCAAEGATCVPIGDSAVRCASPDAVCDPLAADVDVCSGSQLRMCLRGKIVDFDCAAIGAPCVGPQGTQSGRCGIP